VLIGIVTLHVICLLLSLSFDRTVQITERFPIVTIHFFLRCSSAAQWIEIYVALNYRRPRMELYRTLLLILSLIYIKVKEGSHNVWYPTKFLIVGSPISKGEIEYRLKVKVIFL
jgi:hypothetical protein